MFHRIIYSKQESQSCQICAERNDFTIEIGIYRRDSRILTPRTQLVWLVTGCATGFGKELVHAVLDRGDKCIATARRASERLLAQQEAGGVILDLDVTAPQDELNAKVEEATKAHGKIDVLVNNAGYVTDGFWEELG